jgi:hypothetical protein
MIKYVKPISIIIKAQDICRVNRKVAQTELIPGIETSRIGATRSIIINCAVIDCKSRIASPEIYLREDRCLK